jgi:biopolymer transport protein ExbD
MRFGKISLEESEPVPMAPLIDIVFLTLVFFMVTSVYSTMEAEVGVTLPTAESAQIDNRTQGEIYINVRADGAYVVNGREVDLVELQDILNRVAQFFPGGSVIIRGDTEAALGRAVAVLDACKKSDIQNVSIAAMPEARTGAQ